MTHNFVVKYKMPDKKAGLHAPPAAGAEVLVFKTLAFTAEDALTQWQVWLMAHLGYHWPKESRECVYPLSIEAATPEEK